MTPRHEEEEETEEQQQQDEQENKEQEEEATHHSGVLGPLEGRDQRRSDRGHTWSRGLKPVNNLELVLSRSQGGPGPL